MKRKLSVSILFVLVISAGLASNLKAQKKCTGNTLFTEPSCVGDEIDRTESDLLERVNAYRKQKGKPPVTVSKDLSLVANRHLLDLVQNVGTITHSWSNCPYDIRVQSTWPCIMDAPKKFAITYRGEGYETLYHTDTGTVRPELALDAWKKSTLHNSIILNLAAFADMEWDALGVAISGQYAALWFGSPRRTATGLVDNSAGLGVTLAQAIDGLTDIVRIKKTVSTVEHGKWSGTTPDGEVKVEMLGNYLEIAEASARLSIRLDANGRLSDRNRTVLDTLLKNVFPEWTGRGEWLDSSLAALGANSGATRTKVVRKIEIEIRAGSGRTVVLNIRPENKVSAIEF